MRAARPRPRSGRLRYTKAALLLFGAGLVAGFVVVVGEFPEGERPAAALMALALALIPVGLFADGHGMAAIRWVAARLSRRSPKKRRGKAPAPRPRPKASARPSPRRAAGRAPQRGR